MAIRDLKSVKYTDDEGHGWSTKMDAATFAQLNGDDDPLVGGEDLVSGTFPPLPRSLKPRHVTVTNGGNKRKVICLTPDSTLYTGIDDTINLQVLGGAAVAYVRYRATGERWAMRHDPSQ